MCFKTKRLWSKPLGERDNTDYCYIQQDGTPDASFFAPDCFHFSSKGHAAAGQELWNNMVSVSYCKYFDDFLRMKYDKTMHVR